MATITKTFKIGLSQAEASTIPRYDSDLINNKYVAYTTQTLTSAEQDQARYNIGAISIDDVSASFLPLSGGSLYGGLAVPQLSVYYEYDSSIYFVQSAYTNNFARAHIYGGADNSPPIFAITFDNISNPFQIWGDGGLVFSYIVPYSDATQRIWLPTKTGTMALTNDFKTVNGHSLIITDPNDTDLEIKVVGGATVTISATDITNMFDSFIRGYYTMSNGIQTDVFLQKGMTRTQSKGQNATSTSINVNFQFDVGTVFTSANEFSITATTSQGNVWATLPTISGGVLSVDVAVQNVISGNYVEVSCTILNTTKALAYYVNDNGDKITLPYGTSIKAYTVS